MSSGLFSNSRDYGLSSDDDEDSGGALIHDEYAQHHPNRVSSSSQSRHRSQKSGATRGPHSSNRNLSSSRHTYSTQNSVSLADFDKEYVDMDDDDDDNDRVRKGGHRRKGDGGGRGRLGGAAVDWTGEMTKLLLTSSKWKLALVGLALGLLCAVSHQSYLWMTSERSPTGIGLPS